MRAVPRRARLAAVCGGSRRALSSNAGDRWQLGTLAIEVACTPCVVTAPWGAARKGAAFAPSRPAAGTAFADACRALLNPANPSLAGTARPYFPRGGPLPPPPPAGLETSSRGWGGIDAGEGMLYPAQVVDGLVHAHAGSRLRSALTEVQAGEGGVRCAVGGALATPAFELAAFGMPHGPRTPNPENEQTSRATTAPRHNTPVRPGSSATHTFAPRLWQTLSRTRRRRFGLRAARRTSRPF